MNDITVTGNTIDKCHWGMEFWADGGGSLSNLTVSGNTFTDTALGWSANQRWYSFVYEGAHISDLKFNGFTKSNISITNNVFGTTGAKLLNLTGTGWALSGNTYKQYAGKPFGYIGDTNYTYDSTFIADTLPTIDATADAKVLENNNLVVNGDFETGTMDGWSINNGADNDWRTAIDDSNDHVRYTGKYALRVRFGYVSTYQTITVEPYTDYQYTVYIKRDGQGASTTFNFAADGGNTMLSTVTPTDSLYFKKYTGTFNTGSATEIIAWFISNNGNENSYTYFDDISLVKAPEKPPIDDGNIVVNGGFEKGSQGWTINDKVTISRDSSVAHTGDGFFNINQNFYSMSSQALTLKPNTNYEYSLWYKVASPGSADWNFMVFDYPAQVVLGDSQVKFADTNGSWVKLEGEFNSGTHITDTRIFIFNDGEHGTFFIDDIVVKEKEDDFVNLVSNGNFENGADGWTVDSKATISDDYTVAHGGSKFFNINQNYYSMSSQAINEIWPELVKVLKDAGICNYTIWNVGNELFGYYECEKGVKFAADTQANSKIVDKWNEYMKDVMVMEQDPVTGAQPLLTKVFELN